MEIFKVINNPKSGRTVICICGIKLSFINKNNIYKPDYNCVIKKIQNKYKNKEKIRVGFLVNQNAKWNAENLYNLLEEHEHFEPVILVTAYDSLHNKTDLTKDTVEENYTFFKNAGKNVVKAYDDINEEYLDINQFDIDILFYDNQVISLDTLIIPHRFFHRRAFLMVPMLEIAQDYRHPIYDKTVLELYEELENPEMVCLYGTRV